MALVATTGAGGHCHQTMLVLGVGVVIVISMVQGIVTVIERRLFIIKWQEVHALEMPMVPLLLTHSSVVSISTGRVVLTFHSCVIIRQRWGWGSSSSLLLGVGWEPWVAIAVIVSDVRHQ